MACRIYPGPQGPRNMHTHTATHCGDRNFSGFVLVVSFDRSHAGAPRCGAERVEVICIPLHGKVSGAAIFSKQLAGQMFSDTTAARLRPECANPLRDSLARDTSRSNYL